MYFSEIPLRAALYFSLVLSVISASGQDSVGGNAQFHNLDMKQYNNLTTLKNKTVLVNFNADWCVVCKREAPVLKQLSLRHPEVTFLDIDMEDNPAIADYFEVDGLPVTIIYYNGIMMWNRMGFQPLEVLENELWLYRNENTQLKSKTK